MLNKKGWGLVEMLVLTGVLAIFLFIAIFLIYNAYRNLDTSISNNYYHDLENKLEEQAAIYLDKYYDEDLTSDYVTITRNVLKVYDLDVTLSDPSGKACDGYIKANKTKGVINIDGYIKCANYTTTNY